jgi:hypothetical protein
MPNLYATPTEIKEAIPKGIASTTTDYDGILLGLADRVSRAIDHYTRRHFFPRLETRYFDGSWKELQWIDDLFSITSVNMSEDGGATYTAIASSDYIACLAGSPNVVGSYDSIRLDVNGAYSEWYDGQRSVKIVGLWAHCDDRDDIFQDSLDTVEDNPLASDGTTIHANDVDGADAWGFTPRFQVGQLLKFGSGPEFAEVSAVATATTDNYLTVVRNRNGSTAVSTLQNTGLYVFKPPAPIKQATIIQAVRLFQRGLQGFEDARANPELGQTVYTKAFDPDVKLLLEPYVKRYVLG